MATVATVISIAVMGQRAGESLVKAEISAENGRAGSNYLAYPGPQQEQLTPAPEGYVPFYISHYGRHGSRFLIDTMDYVRPIQVLQRADSAGVLTEEGRDVLRRVRRMYAESYKRWGELTQLGAEQHRGIARRMYERFPEVYADSAEIDAKSTVVIRCILSMENELLQLAAMNPDLRIVHDASEHDMYYMNQPDKQLDSLKRLPAVNDAFRAFCARHSHPARLMRVLFSDKKYVKRNVDGGQLSSALFSLATALQNTELRKKMTLYDVFTDDELYEHWQMSNAWWYMHYCSTPLNGGTQPYSQRNLLSNIIAQADSCIALSKDGWHGATLRFGHETMVLPLTCLLNLNGFGKEVASPDDLEKEGMVLYRVFPMAANIQFVFYRQRNVDSPILFKVLLNENEATLPLPADFAPYYRWADFRTYYLQKLDDYRFSSNESK